MVLKKKENLEDDEDDLIYEEEDIYAPQRAGRLKRITDIGFHFVDDPERDEQRTFRRGGSMGPKPMRERATDGGGDSYSGGYGGFGRGGTRGTSRGGYRRVIIIIKDLYIFIRLVFIFEMFFIHKLKLMNPVIDF